MRVHVLLVLDELNDLFFQLLLARRAETVVLIAHHERRVTVRAVRRPCEWIPNDRDHSGRLLSSSVGLNPNAIIRVPA